MNLSAPFIRRPVMTTLVMASFVFFGWFAYRDLPVSDLPSVDFPTIQVSASLPGASPETMAASVATPLEKEFSTIAGVDSMNSVSNQGSTSITLQFALERNIDAAAADVQASIARVSRTLPSDMPAPPSYRKVNPADSPVLFLACTSATLPMYALDEYAQTVLSQKMGQVPGVAQVQVFGSQKYAVRIQVDSRKLAARGLGIDEVARAVQDRNVNLPVGVISGPRESITLESTGQLLSADRFGEAIIAYRNGSPVRLDQVGRVIDSVENDKSAAWYYADGIGERSVILAVQRQPGANTVDVVQRVKDLLPTIRRQVPPSVGIHVLYDRSVSIRASVSDVKHTLVVTLLLVVVVIFIFLRSIRATIIPSLAMPLSILATFAVMRLLGFSLDNLSLMALTLSVGFVVDDAIVMLENIIRHIEMGKSPVQAAFDGSQEVGFTILSMTVSLVAVFIPVLFMGGLVGRLLNEFAITIAVAILASGIVSLTLTPMLSARFLRAGHVRHGRLYNLTERGFDLLLAVYSRTLRWALAGRVAVLIASLGILAATAWMFLRVPKGFLPSDDQGRISVTTEAPEGTSFAQMTRYQQALADIAVKNPEVESFMSSIGSRGGSATGTNSGTMFIKLRDLPGRTEPVDRVIQELRAQLAQVGAVRAVPQNPPSIRIGGQITKSLYQYTLQGPDTDELYRAAPALAERMQAIPGLQDVTTDLQLSSPKLVIDINRDKAATLGVTPAQIELALSSAYGTRRVSTIFAPNNDYNVILELIPELQGDPSWIDTLYVRSAAGPLVQLTSLAHLSRTTGPLTVNHLGQLPSVTISFNLAPGASLSGAVREVDAAAREVLPPTITASFQGTAQAFQSSLAGLGMLLVLALVVTYIILGILYESFIHPLTIYSALPFAGFGALATLKLFHVELSLYAFVGIIMLIGLVKKNGIMMVDFAIQESARGAPPRDAIYRACIVRFRPIMMTTMAALMGTLPIALGWGAGAESRRPLGLAVVGGLLFSQLVTLYATPVFYLYLDRLSKVFTPRPVTNAAPAGVPALRDPGS
ncbi:MAG: efflux RND transporter permease subunit [Phycisphaerales bacterium]|nr:efflux RND transporter permease subunit [Phycisphaerales bacterium]